MIIMTSIMTTTMRNKTPTYPSRRPSELNSLLTEGSPGFDSPSGSVLGVINIINVIIVINVVIAINVIIDECHCFHHHQHKKQIEIEIELYVLAER